jgi:hypothetical protein
MIETIIVIAITRAASNNPVLDRPKSVMSPERRANVAAARACPALFIGTDPLVL